MKSNRFELLLVWHILLYFFIFLQWFQPLSLFFFFFGPLGLGRQISSPCFYWNGVLHLLHGIIFFSGVQLANRLDGGTYPVHYRVLVSNFTTVCADQDKTFEPTRCLTQAAPTVRAQPAYLPLELTAQFLSCKSFWNWVGMACMMGYGSHCIRVVPGKVWRAVASKYAFNHVRHGVEVDIK